MAPNRNQKTELEILIGDKTIPTSLGEITLRPFKFKDFSKVLQVINRYLSIFAESETTAQAVKTLLANADEQTIPDILLLIKLTTDLEREQLEELTWDEVANLFLVVVEENLDFFFRAAAKLGKLGKGEEKEEQKAGQ